jgi:serralysin
MVAWKVTGSDAYIVWNTDSSGNYVSSATSVVTGESFALEDLETTFQDDLNGDGRLSTQLITTGSTVNLNGQSTAATINLGPDIVSASGGLSQPTLTFTNGPPEAITLGSGASTVEYALQPSSGIQTVAGFIPKTDELNIDLAGAANTVLQASITSVTGNSAIALYSNADPTHGIVLLGVTTSGLTASAWLSAHTTFVDGHALIT